VVLNSSFLFRSFVEQRGEKYWKTKDYLGIPAWNQGAHLSRASSSRLVKLSVLTGSVGR
jgi:hypothetical protein